MGDPLRLMNFISSKTRANGLPGSEDVIILRSFVLTQYRCVMDRQTHRQTDRQTDRRTEMLQFLQLIKTALSIAARYKNSRMCKKFSFPF